MQIAVCNNTAPMPEITHFEKRTTLCYVRVIGCFEARKPPPPVSPFESDDIERRPPRSLSMNDGNKYWQDLAIELIKFASSLLSVFGAWLKIKDHGNGPHESCPKERTVSKPTRRKRTRSRGR